MEDVVSTGSPEWDVRYPDREQLRREIAAMIDSFVEALVASFPAGAIAAVWWKGSSHKEWDSPIDYVPELSDVDLHVQFTEDRADNLYFASLDDALDLQHRAEAGFRERIADPLHVPRVQMIVANVLHREPDVVPTPVHAVKTVYGSLDPPVMTDRVHSQSWSLKLLLSHEEYVRDLPEQVVDKVGPHLWSVLRSMTWRVGPTGPRVLEALGTLYEDAWGVNRTGVVSALRERGQDALADDYVRFYLGGWRHFLSGYQDSEEARQTIRAGARVLERGAAITHQLGQALAEK